eukprot:evm.model.NODE_27596_length_23439_cov_34.245060.7
MDNFEWADGYRPRFGIIRVNFTSQARYPKQSALMYKEMMTRFSPTEAVPVVPAGPAAAAAAAAPAAAEE